MRMLIVDDEFVARNALKHVLSEFGQCVDSDKGNKAIELFKEAWNNWRPFNMIFLDIELDDTTGLNVLNSIRALEHEKGIPPEEGVRVIMVTSHSAKDIVMDCMKAGCNEFLVKPIDNKIIKQKMQNLGTRDGVFGKRTDGDVQDD